MVTLPFLPNSPPASTENVLRSSSSQQQNIAAKFQLSPSFYESGQEKGSKIPDLKEIPAFEDEDELLFGAGTLIRTVYLSLTVTKLKRSLD